MYSHICYIVKVYKYDYNKFCNSEKKPNHNKFLLGQLTNKNLSFRDTTNSKIRLSIALMMLDTRFSMILNINLSTDN
jgi:hypothetical protein